MKYESRSFCTRLFLFRFINRNRNIAQKEYALNPPRTFWRTKTFPRRRQMRCSHLDGHQRRPRIAFALRPGRASAALLLWVPALSPRTHAWKITLFAARGLLMSAPHCLVFVLGFQSWRVDSQGDKSKLRSIEVKVRGPTLPATRSNHQVGYGDNRV